jgi:hypothetical protein
VLIDDMTNSLWKVWNIRRLRETPGGGHASRSARRGLHAADSGTSSHFLRSSPGVRLVKAQAAGRRKRRLSLIPITTLAPLQDDADRAVRVAERPWSLPDGRPLQRRGCLARVLDRAPRRLRPSRRSQQGTDHRRVRARQRRGRLSQPACRQVPEALAGIARLTIRRLPDQRLRGHQRTRQDLDLATARSRSGWSNAEGKQTSADVQRSSQPAGHGWEFESSWLGPAASQTAHPSVQRIGRFGPAAPVLASARARRRLTCAGEPLVGSDRWSCGGVSLGCRLVVAGFLNLVCGRLADHSALCG